MLQGSLLQAKVLLHRRQDVLCGADVLFRNASRCGCSGDDACCFAGAIGELTSPSNRQKPANFCWLLSFLVIHLFRYTFSDQDTRLGCVFGSTITKGDRK